MKLSNELIRDTLLCIENKCESYTDEEDYFIDRKINWKLIYEDDYLNSKYDIDDIKYCIKKIQEAGFIDTVCKKRGNDLIVVLIKELTYKGHEHLENIKDADIWNSFKGKLGDISKFSFSVLAKLASEFALAYGKQKLGLM